MPARYLTVQDLLSAHPLQDDANIEFYKFVKVDNQYRFRPVEYGCAHKDLVDSGEKVQAAGMIAVYPEHWSLRDSYSMTLHIGCHEEDVAELTELLGRPEYA